MLFVALVVATSGVEDAAVTDERTDAGDESGCGGGGDAQDVAEDDAFGCRLDSFDASLLFDVSPDNEHGLADELKSLET